jgi:hypothetical protein
VLNTLQGQKDVFDFLGVPKKDRTYQDHLRYNTRKPERDPWTEEAGFTWMKRILETAQEIQRVLPRQSRFILVDQEQIIDYVPAGFHVIPFLERNGVYYGPPPDDGTAIRELKRLRRTDADFMVFAWPAFWWLDHYTVFTRYLRSEHRCFYESERIIAFDIRKVSHWTGKPGLPGSNKAAAKAGWICAVKTA